MNFQIDPLFATVVICCAIVAHMALAASTRYLNPMITLVGAFFALAPWAVAVLPGAEALKVGRLYLTVLAVVIAVLFQRQFRMNLTAILFLTFLTYYTLAALWSDNPINGVIFKAMVLPAALMGAMCVTAFRDEHDLKIAMRTWTVFSLLFLLPVTVYLLSRGITLAMGGRFTPFGINPNRVGHECASMLIVCMPIALYDKSVRWKMFAYGVGTMAAACILASGSRAAVGQAVIAALIMGLPLVKRPILPLSLGAVSAAILWFLMPSGTDYAYGRYSEINFSNRQGMWMYALERFREAPFTGNGWVYDDSYRASGSTANLHSIYLQILAELGLFGFAFMIICIAMLGWGYYSLWRLARQHSIQTRWVFTGAAFGAATLAHGMAESSTFMPGTINLLLLGVSFGLIGPLRQMILNRQLGETGSQFEDDSLAGDDPYADYGQDTQTA